VPQSAQKSRIAEPDELKVFALPFSIASADSGKPAQQTTGAPELRLQSTQ
jgi:hypothetical protein